MDTHTEQAVPELAVREQAVRERAARRPGSAAAPGRAGTASTEVFDAVLDLLVEVGYEALTMDAVAHRAHVSKATIYKRWDGKPRLVVAALGRHASTPADCPVAEDPVVPGSVAADPGPPGGSLRADLLGFARMLNAGEDRTGALLAALAHAVQRDPDLAATVRVELAEPCTAALGDILARARARGETTARPEDLGAGADVLPAMVILPVLFGGRRLDDAGLESLVDLVVRPLIEAADTRRAADTSAPMDSRAPMNSSAPVDNRQDGS